MTIEQKQEITKRINSVCQSDKAKYGRMNVNQMICHCADQLRMAFGEVKGLYKENVDLVKIREMMVKGETVQTVDGLDQVAGQGTKPSNLENDKAILISYLNKFFESSVDQPFHFHPFLGDMDKTKWDRLVIYHLDHHLSQFGK